MRKEGNGLEFISKGRRRRNEKLDFATFVPFFRQKNRMLHGSPKSLILQGKFRPASHAGGPLYNPQISPEKESSNRQGCKKANSLNNLC